MGNDKWKNRMLAFVTKVHGIALKEHTKITNSNVYCLKQDIWGMEDRRNILIFNYIFVSFESCTNSYIKYSITWKQNSISNGLLRIRKRKNFNITSSRNLTTCCRCLDEWKGVLGAVWDFTGHPVRLANLSLLLGSWTKLVSLLPQRTSGGQCFLTPMPAMQHQFWPYQNILWVTFSLLLLLF